MVVALELTAAVEEGSSWMARAQPRRTSTRGRGLGVATVVEAIEVMMVMGCKV